jgi:hypothetical protein
MAGGIRGNAASLGLLGSLGKTLVLALHDETIYLLLDYRWWLGTNQARHRVSDIQQWIEEEQLKPRARKRVCSGWQPTQHSRLDRPTSSTSSRPRLAFALRAWLQVNIPLAAQAGSARLRRRAARRRRKQVPLGGSVRREGVPRAGGEPGLPPADYHGPVSGRRVSGGVVHELPADLREALIANATALDAWNDITPLARNEFICWVEDAKQATTRERRIRRTQEELEEGQRRPCCWPGCKHRERTGR